ncbi:MAG: efflux RND transporter periplasmic adaptor subunit [Acidobacteria bacterium]|nr:efflux RND transporter periplasmic adaptor subunit [Acidobacteriota bacterium]
MENRLLAGARTECPHITRLIIILSITLILFGCSKPQAAEVSKPAPPAKVENTVKETELAMIKLTPQAEQRLGIETAATAIQSVAETRSFAGEIVLPPDRTTSVATPMAGTLDNSPGAPIVGLFVRKGQPLFRVTPFLSPERDVRLQLERDVTAAQTKVEAARVRLNRAEQLLRDKAGSEKSVQQSREELDLAENELKAARARLERFDSKPLTSDYEVTITAPRDGMITKVFTNPGQSVAGGAPLLEIANLSSLWIRVPVYVGDLRELAPNQSARIHNLADAPGAATKSARPVKAPPTADPLANTADLYFEIANTDSSWRPGQRMGVTLSLKGTTESLVVPWSAVVYDINGGAWVYETTAPQTYVRRRIEIARVVGSLAVLNRGPAVGAKVAITGVAELFGTEFSTGK